MFLWLLHNNGILYRPDGAKRIADGTLVALTLMIAEAGWTSWSRWSSTLEEFCQIYPELLAQAREYAVGTI